MSETSLSSNEVPGKFEEWLLGMGCPASLEKISEMCRGQYYMVWRSVMEHIEARDVIKRKRLQVFCDDIKKCRNEGVFTTNKSNPPNQLVLWRRQQEIRRQVQEAEERAVSAKKELGILMDMISNKMVQRRMSRSRLDEIKRRAWFLQQMVEELKNKKTNLTETKSIAEALCSVGDDGDIQSKLDRCVSSLRRQSSVPVTSHVQMPNPIASSSLVSNCAESEFEEQLSSLVKCRGDALCTQLYERRAALALADNAATDNTPTTKISPQYILAHTAALHSTLALEGLKNKIHTQQAQKRLVDAIADLSSDLSSDECELLVVQCEKVCTQARVTAMQVLLDEMRSRAGVFSVCAHEHSIASASRSVAAVHKAIEAKRDELEKVIESLLATEKKLDNVRDCLVAVFNGFHRDFFDDSCRYRGARLDLPSESVSTLRHFYEHRVEKRRRKMELSLDMETSNNSIDDIDMTNLRFIDDLKVFMKKFNLEKNRKLVLESGDKIWIFETLKHSAERIQSQWHSEDLTSSLIHPAISLTGNLTRLCEKVEMKGILEAMLRSTNRRETGEKATSIDLDPQTKEEEQTTDRMKKRLGESLQSVQKINKALEYVEQSLGLWADDAMRKHIPRSRTVQGMTYKDFERYYLEGL